MPRNYLMTGEVFTRERQVGSRWDKNKNSVAFRVTDSSYAAESWQVLALPRLSSRRSLLASGGPLPILQMRLTLSRPLLRIAAFVAISFGLGCSTEPAPPPTQLKVKTAPSPSAVNRAVLATQPAIQLSDAAGNAVAQADVAVTVTITSGGGTVGGTTIATTDANGTATFANLSIGGSVGTRTLTFSSAGLSSIGAQVTTTAGSATTIAVNAGDNQSAPVGSTLQTSPSVKVTDADGNGVSGISVTFEVTSGGGSATGLTQSTDVTGVAKPTSWTLGSTLGTNTMTATAAGLTGSPVTLTATAAACSSRLLLVGQAVTVTAAGEQACNEIVAGEASPSGSARYYVAVSNTSTTYNTTGAAFQLKGSVPGGAAVAGRFAVRPDADSPRERVIRPLSLDEIAEQAHLRILEQNIRYLRENRAALTARRGGATLAAISTTPTVGTGVSINIPNVNNGNICQNPIAMTGRIVYVGTKSVIVEDNANPGAGTLDTMYTRVGGEFDNVMFPILSNYGNPLAKDATTDNNGRIVMVFSRKISDNFTSLAGFVVSCDFAATATASNTQTNSGEYFYARAPLAASGTISNVDSPAYWNWTMRPTIIHEVKHIVSFAERLSRSASSFEESWLEESTARLSEELYERAVYSLSQKANIGYGSSGNPVGPYCGVRACGTPAKARGIVRVFEELSSKWYTAPELYSPIGRIDASDFSFYATGWSLVRWAIDQGSANEAAFLQALTQETSLSGVANLQARAGRSFADLVQEWSLAMVVDDYPSFIASGTPATRMAQPSWNLRSVYAGYDTDFNVPWTTWPLAPVVRTMGTFTIDVSNIRAGTSAIIELTGPASTRQRLDLTGAGGSGAPPAELRIAIIRVP